MVALLVLIFLLLAAAPAAAGTVTLGEASSCDKGGCATYSTVTFTAAPGEVNDVSATASGDEVAITDVGGPVSAGPGCRSVEAQTVTCAGTHGPPVVRLVLGDGDDRGTGSRDTEISGGDGDDRLTGGKLYGGEGNDTLDGDDFNEGGPGDDRLYDGGDAGPGDDVVDLSGQPESRWVIRLGPGADVLIGGPGGDYVEDSEAGEPSRDRIDGGGGHDTIDYRHSPVAITGDLGQASQFPAHDEVSGFESVHASHFADHLLGSDGRDDLNGAAGDDVLEGRGGDDILSGEAGADRIDGGPGDDQSSGGAQADVITLGEGNDSVFSQSDHHRDQVDCGHGTDQAEVDRGDHHTGCELEEVFAAPRYVTAIEPARGGRWRIAYEPCEDTWPSCEGTTEVRTTVRGRAVRMPTVRFQGSLHGQSRLVSNAFRLPRAAARELRRRGALSVRLKTVLAPGERGGLLPSEQRFRLRAGRRRAAQDR